MNIKENIMLVFRGVIDVQANIDNGLYTVKNWGSCILWDIEELMTIALDSFEMYRHIGENIFVVVI